MVIRCITAATSSDGTPDFHLSEITCTQSQYDNGDHYEAAKEQASEDGYEGDMVCFDGNDGSAFLFRHFQNDVWTQVTI
jgi:hypothetical protein